MFRCLSPTSTSLLAAAWLLCCAALPPAFGGPVRLERRAVASLTVSALTAAEETPPLEFRVDPEKGARVETKVAWPQAGQTNTLRIEAVDRSEGHDPTPLIELVATLIPPDGKPRQVKRLWSVEDGATRLLVLHRAGDAAFSVGLEVSLTEEPFLPAARRVTRPVRYLVQIERLLDGQVIPLEQNTLNTFLGDPVRYAFELGDGPTDDALELTLTPVTVGDRVLTTRTDLSGRIPGADGPQLISRSERLLSSSGVTSRVDAQVGEPPRGYRFSVTPFF